MASAHKVILIAVVVVLLPRSSQAQRTIAIEFYDGERPDDADEHVGPVLDELGAQGAITGAAVGRSYEDTVSRSGSVVDPAALASVPALADEGFRAWTEARFGDAVELLQRAIRTAQEAPRALQRGDLRNAYRMALIGLSLAHKRLGHRPEAIGAMAELMRSFPDQPPLTSDFGSEAARLYLDVKAELTKLGTGTLSVTVDDPDAIVLVNEHYIASPETMTHLIPGPYRLMARKRKTNGRAYRATVEPGKTTAIRIAWGLDQVVKTDPSWTGLLFTSAKARERGLEGSVRQLAALLGAQTVIAVGISREKGRRSVIGMTFVMGQRPGPARSASLAIEGQEVSDDRLAQLGEYLAGTRDRPPTDPAIAVVQPSRESSPRARSGLLWGGVVAGLGGIGAGIYFLRRDGELQCEDLGSGRRDCPTVQHTAALGYGLIGAGTAAAGLSSYFLWRSHRRSPQVAVQLGRVSGIAVAGEF